MRKLLLFTLLLSLGSAQFSCAYFNTYYNAKKYYNSGRKASEKNTRIKITQSEVKNYELAIEKCKLVIRKFPDSRYVDDALLIMGKSYYYLGDYENSKINLEELLRRYPESDLTNESLLWSGRAAWKLGQYTIAEEGITKVLELTNDDKLLSAGYEMLSEIYRDKGSENLELKYLRENLKYSKNDQQKAEINYRIGTILLGKGDFENAISAFKKVESLLPNPELLEKAKMDYTRSLKHLGRTNEALDILQSMHDSERFKKIRGEIENEIADISFRGGDTDGAIEMYGDVGINYRNTTSSAHAWFILGNLHLYPIDSLDSRINYHFAREYYARSAKSKKKNVYTNSSRRNKRILNGFLASQETTKIDNIELLWLSGEKEKAEDLLREYTIVKKEFLYDILPAQKQKQGVKGKTDNLASGKTDESDENTTDELLNSEFANLKDEDEEIEEKKSDLMKDDFKIFGLTEIPIDSSEALKEKVKTVVEEKKPKKESRFGKRAYDVVLRELIMSKYLMAEYYYLDLAQPDSARQILERILRDHHNSEFAPRAALTLGLLYDSVYENEQYADSMFHLVINDYSESPSVIEASRHLKIPIEEKGLSQNPEMEIYDRAFNEGLIRENRTEALKLVQQLESEYPYSAYAAKAAYLRASIMDNRNESPEISHSEYKRIVEQYPDTKYAKEARSKMNRLALLIKSKVTEEKETEEYLKEKLNKLRRR